MRSLRPRPVPVAPRSGSLPPARSPASRRPRRWLTAGALLFASATAAHAGWLHSRLSNDLDVIAVTDVTDAGRRLATPTAEHPAYYMMLNLGARHFGSDWSGEVMPPPIRTMHALERSLVSQGYRLADRSHPPSVLLVYGWGLLSGSQARPALRFLGADKTDLHWQLSFAGTSSSFTRSTLADQIWEFAGDDLFLCVLRAYTVDSLRGPHSTLLWETRFAAPSTGFTFRDSMPLMIRAAAAQFGRDTPKPVSIDATQNFAGQVLLGPMRTLDGPVNLPSLPPTSAEPKPAAPPPKAKR